MERKKSYCLICGMEKAGIPIKEDRIVHAMRWLNKNLRRVDNSMNTIVICEACYPKYSKYHKKFKSRQAAYVGIGIVFLLLGIVEMIFTKNIGAVVMGLVFIAILYAFSLLSYVPDLDIRGRMKEKIEKWKENKIKKKA